MVEAFIIVLTIANVLPILPVVLQFTAEMTPPDRRRLRGRQALPPGRVSPEGRRG
jgi:small neutral amino acid transporter SnatA (MarC family)